MVVSVKAIFFYKKQKPPFAYIGEQEAGEGSRCIFTFVTIATPHPLSMAFFYQVPKKMSHWANCQYLDKCFGDDSISAKSQCYTETISFVALNS